jgi:hypothetical protein
MMRSISSGNLNSANFIFRPSRTPSRDLKIDEKRNPSSNTDPLPFCFNPTQGFRLAPQHSVERHYAERQVLKQHSTVCYSAR